VRRKRFYKNGLLECLFSGEADPTYTNKYILYIAELLNKYKMINLKIITLNGFEKSALQGVASLKPID